jgi:TRAP-type C4-dicarboxylate transport system permease small subunit
MKKLKTIFPKIESLSQVIGYVALFMMMLLITVDTAGRYFFNQPIHGAFEITEDYLMVMVVFLGLSYSYKKGEHIKIDLLYRHFPNKVKSIVDCLGLLLTAVLFSLITYQGYSLTFEAWVQKQYIFGVISLPSFLSYIWVPVGSAVLTIRLMIEFFKTIRTLFWGKKGPANV